MLMLMQILKIVFKTIDFCISWGIKNNFDNIKMYGMYVKLVNNNCHNSANMCI